MIRQEIVFFLMKNNQVFLIRMVILRKVVKSFIMIKGYILWL